MKISRHGSRRRRSQAFTLVEILMVMATSLVVIGVVLGTHLYGLRTASRIQVKLAASDDARQAMGKLIQDIRSAISLRIGNGTATTFTDAAANGLQQGDALQIYTTMSTNTWIRYYYSASDNTLRRTINGASASLVTANSITNDTPIFTQQNYNGTAPLTSRSPVGVIQINLNFTQLRSPLVNITPGGYFDYYRLLTTVSPRARL